MAARRCDCRRTPISTIPAITGIAPTVFASKAKPASPIDRARRPPTARGGSPEAVAGGPAGPLTPSQLKSGACLLLLFRRPFLQQRLCRLLLRGLFSIHPLAHVWLLKSGRQRSELSVAAPEPGCQAPWCSEWLVYSAMAIGAPPLVGRSGAPSARRARKRAPKDFTVNVRTASAD